MHINSNLPKKILAWYDNNRRNLPWRVGKKSPNKLYYRLLSEFMLQQTQVKTVIPYFNNFTNKYKSLAALSKSSEKNNINYESIKAQLNFFKPFVFRRFLGELRQLLFG